jgi:glutathione peroxidase
MKTNVCAVAAIAILAATIRPGAIGAQSIHEFAADDIRGERVALDRYDGNVLLIVNTASKCGFTYQFEGLQRLYERYRDRGFLVLGFPSDNFAGQEVDSDAEILGFCEGEYGVTFPMFSKIDVVGPDAHPLYRYLTSADAGLSVSGPITWNFNKFLVGRDGRVLARFGSRVEPEDPRLIQSLERALDS